jgi:hypothetical protein
MLSDAYCTEPQLPRTQRDTVRDVLLLAARYDAWMTLDELARKTEFPPASISAQLRHLRKVEHGGYLVEKRRREWAEKAQSGRRVRVYEYQIKPD